MSYVFSITRFLDDTPAYSVYRIPAEAAVMNHSEQPPVLKLSENLGNGICGQFREHPRKILIGHPNPITAGMKMTLSSPLFPIKLVKLNVYGRRGETKSLDPFKHEWQILHDQSSSMNELKRLRL